jgi:hypothetical protein
MKKNTSGIYQSRACNFSEIVHGFSTRQFGDMREKEKRKSFLLALGIQVESVVWQEQIHRDVIRVVGAIDRGTTISGVDGMVYKKNLNDPPIVLPVHTADCVPLLAVDPVEKIIGVAHAGWKGTTLHIGKKCIREMEKLGANASDIRVVIGPRIGMCCYTITANRADVFREKFPGSDVVVEKDENFFADIGKANYLDLLSVGIKPGHIDYDPSLCTFCKDDDFYSFRKSGLPMEGEILGIIGFI